MLDCDGSRAPHYGERNLIVTPRALDPHPTDGAAQAIAVSGEVTASARASAVDRLFMTFLCCEV
jgi:hypothetical protein